MASSSIKFERPPIAELVLGVQFMPIAISGCHVGWFWRDCLDDEWANAVEVHPVTDQHEIFTEAPKIPYPPEIAALMGVMGVASFRRVQITNDSGRMIQIQPTRFHYNWQKQGDEYPSYQQIRQEFEAQFENFRLFLAEAHLGDLQPNQWEIIYVDHIPKGDLWETPADWNRVLPGLFGKSPTLDGLELENVGSEWHFEITPQKGRLHFAVQLGAIGEQAQKTLVLTTTARGAITEDIDLGAGLTLGHERILRAFDQLTSPEAQSTWKRVLP